LEKGISGKIEGFRDLGGFESAEEPANRQVFDGKIKRGRVVFPTKLRVKPDFEN
jgi:hypothetical protein